MPAAARVVVLDTATRRQLGGDYNARRRECEAAAEALGLPSLRELPSEELDHALARLDAVAARRARHVVLENSRTLEGVAALRAGDLPGFGRLLDASHASLRDDFDVSTRELNAIVEIARALPGCFGARMTGAGFGGCAVALVAVDATDAFVASVSLAYASATGLTPQLYACQASDGATLVEL